MVSKSTKQLHHTNICEQQAFYLQSDKIFVFLNTAQNILFDWTNVSLEYEIMYSADLRSAWTDISLI